MKAKLIISLAIVAAFAALTSSCKAEKLFNDNSTGTVEYSCTAPFEGKTLLIHYHIPEGDASKMPVQIVMHGMGRNGDGYRDAWIPKSDEYGFIVIVPTFSDEEFGEEQYQQGSVVDGEGNYVSRDEMTYVLVDRVFDFFVRHSSSKARSYNIYGHSAGAQFVHRYLMFNDAPKVDVAVAANSGWYTFPDEEVAYPYGIKEGIEKAGVDLEKYYGRNMTILLGDADTLRTSNLRQTPESDLQGLNRLERGNNFYEFCKNDAERRGYQFNWKKSYVSGSNHSNNKMAPVAADVIYAK